MAASEFALIDRYFAQQPWRRDVELGVGDDCALLRVPPGMNLAISMDTMVAGVHFPVDTPAFDIGYKLVAVNLSDLAAMGAEPAWATLAMTLPTADDTWLSQFCHGLHALSNEFGVQIVGGDTTHGPLTLTLQIHGFVPEGQALRRNGALPGDLIYVTGNLGDGALGLHCLLEGCSLPAQHRNYAISRLNRPTPRLAIGQAIRPFASSAIDISDGLVSDLGHILSASQVGADVVLARLPLSTAMKSALNMGAGMDLALAGGDDYELCFTCPLARRAELESAVAGIDCPISCIGEITAMAGLRLVDAQGNSSKPLVKGYEHFSTN